MTKEELISRAKNIASMYDNNIPQGAIRSKNGIEYLINQFFESNVCIPKGENRHPYADVLHEWIEGTSKCEYRSPSDPVGLDGWLEMTFPSHEYRIKPSEPVYAYIWYRECTDEDREMFSEMEFDSTTLRMTEEELAKNFNSTGWIKIEATKQERK